MKKKDSEVLQEWLDEERMSIPTLAAKLGITKNAVYYHMKNETFGNAFVEMLREAKVKPFVDGEKKAQTANARNLDPGIMIVEVPLITQYAYAGYLSGYSDPEFMEGQPTHPFLVEKEYKGTYRAFEVRGDSMNDGSVDSYLPRDIVLGREVVQHHWRNKLHYNKWDFVIVHEQDGILIKKITDHDVEKGKITAHSLNPEYTDLHIDLADVRQLFNVIKVERTKN